MERGWDNVSQRKERWRRRRAAGKRERRYRNTPISILYLTEDRGLGSTPSFVQRRPVLLLPHRPASSSAQRPSQRYTHSLPHRSSPHPSLNDDNPIYKNMGEKYFMLKDLAPTMKEWKIKCQLLKKEKSYDFTKNNNYGRVINMCFIDEEGTIVQATMFLDTIAKFDGILLEDKFYTISNAQIKEANQRFNKGSIPYNIIFTKHTIISKANAFEIPSNNITTDSLAKQRSCSTIEKLFNSRRDEETIDLIAIAIKIDEPTAVTRRADGKQIHRQILILTDDSCSKTIMLTLWEKFVEKEGKSLLELIAKKPIVLASSERTHSFRGNFGLKTTHQSQIEIFPDNDIAKALTKWANKSDEELRRRVNDDNAEDIVSLKSEKVTIKELKENLTDQHPEDNAYQLQVCIVDINRNQDPWYMACDRCNKSIIKEENKDFCSKCMSNDIKPVNRYYWRINVADDTSNMWISVFIQEAEKIIGISVSELKRKKEMNMSEYISTMENCINKHYLLTVKPSKNGKSDKLNFTCVRVDSIDVKIQTYEDLSSNDDLEEQKEKKIIKRKRLILTQD